MRRPDREMREKGELETVLRSACVCRLGLWDGEWPYVVPVNFGYEDGAIYFHSAAEGKKLELLRKEPRVCIEVEADVEVVLRKPACRSTSRYRSVIALGRAAFVEEREEKLRALRRIVRQCGGDPEGMADDAVERVAVVRVTLEQITGKRSPA